MSTQPAFEGSTNWSWPAEEARIDEDDGYETVSNDEEGQWTPDEEDISASEMRRRPSHWTTNEAQATKQTTTPPSMTSPSSEWQSQSQSQSESQPQSQPRPHNSRRYLPRQCRICLETVYPTFTTPLSSIPSSLQPKPEVRYVSSDPELGRLCKPCLCKGSSKYVHEGCLQSWRHADPSYGARHYWECPTCRFQYRLQRLAWGRYVGSKMTQLLLTISLLFLATFLLGFVADPLINLYSDPWSVTTTTGRARLREKNVIAANRVQLRGWNEHFVKGLASMGLVGFAKVIWALGPTGWFNMRSSNFLGGGRRARNAGRDRVSNLSWLVIIIGIGAFMLAVYKGVNLWSRRFLEKAGERVMDVTPDDGDDGVDEDGETEIPADEPAQHPEAQSTPQTETQPQPEPEPQS